MSCVGNNASYARLFHMHSWAHSRWSISVSSTLCGGPVWKKGCVKVSRATSVPWPFMPKPSALPENSIPPRVVFFFFFLTKRTKKNAADSFKSQSLSLEEINFLNSMAMK